jgi:hypothetical protein
MHRAVLEGVVGSLNGRQTLLGVVDLKTPLGIYPRAVVRQEDIETWEVDLERGEAYQLLELA